LLIQKAMGCSSKIRITCLRFGSIEANMVA